MIEEYKLIKELYEFVKRYGGGRHLAGCPENCYHCQLLERCVEYFKEADLCTDMMYLSREKFKMLTRLVAEHETRLFILENRDLHVGDTMSKKVDFDSNTLSIMFSDLTPSAQKKYLDFYGYTNWEQPNENVSIVILERD
jgi:hypothetical protein